MRERPASSPPPGPVGLLGIELDPVTRAEAVARVGEALRAGRGGTIVTPNLDQLRQVAKQPMLLELFAQASLVVTDGMPLVWASRLQGTPVPERVAGSDLVWSLAAVAEEEGVGLFLLGGNPGAAVSAARELVRQRPGLRIAGTFCPPFGFEHDQAAVADIRRRIEESGARIVYVALGFPKQEQLTARLAPRLSDVWFLGCGISLSFIAGEVRRAPRWMRVAGLEWAHRLAQEPRRLASRYLIRDLPFALRLFGSALWTRLRRRGAGT